jgi:hypothetical protein
MKTNCIQGTTCMWLPNAFIVVPPLVSAEDGPMMMMEEDGSAGSLLAEVHEFDAMWTTQIIQKLKKWNDGVLRFHAFNRRAMLYDESGGFVDDAYLNKRMVEEGDEFRFERVLVSVDAKKRVVERDIAKIFTKTTAPVTATQAQPVVSQQKIHSPSQTSSLYLANTFFPSTGNSRPQGVSHSKGGAPSLGAKRRRVVPEEPKPVDTSPVNVHRSQFVPERQAVPSKQSSESSLQRQESPHNSAARLGGTGAVVTRSPRPHQSNERLMSRPGLQRVSALGRSARPLLSVERTLSSEQLPNEPASPGLQILSQTLDNIDVIPISSDDEQIDGGVDGLVERLSTQIPPVEQDSSDTLLQSPVTPAGDVQIHQRKVALGESGPWTREGLELFVWRPPGLEDQ